MLKRQPQSSTALKQKINRDYYEWIAALSDPRLNRRKHVDNQDDHDTAICNQSPERV